MFSSVQLKTLISTLISAARCFSNIQIFSMYPKEDVEEAHGLLCHVCILQIRALCEVQTLALSLHLLLWYQNQKSTTWCPRLSKVVMAFLMVCSGDVLLYIQYSGWSPSPQNLPSLPWMRSKCNRSSAMYSCLRLSSLHSSLKIRASSRMSLLLPNHSNILSAPGEFLDQNLLKKTRCVFVCVYYLPIIL
jgi:hypothetical protein